MTKRTSGRQRKPRDISPDQTLTPTKRSSRLSTRRRKEETESESEHEEAPLEVKTPSKRGRTSRKPEKKIEEENEEKPEDETAKADATDEEPSKQNSNGVVKPPSLHKRTRHSSRSSDTTEEKKPRSTRKHRHKEEPKLEEEAEEEVKEKEKDEDTVDDGAHRDSPAEKEQPAVSPEKEEEEPEPEKSKEEEEKEEEENSVDEVEKQEVEQDEEDKEVEKEEKEEEDVEEEKTKEREESSSEEEREVEEDEEEEEKPRPQRSSVVAVQQEKSEEDEDAAAPEDEAGEADKDSEAEEEEEQGEGEDVEDERETAEDREEGEIEGSPPPVWSGEQRTWGVSKPNTVFKFLRARDPDVTTSVLKEFNTVVKPLAEDFLDARERDMRREAPVEESSGEEAQPAESRDRRDRRHQQEEEKEGEQHEEEQEEEEGEERKSKERGEEENENPNVKKRKRSEEKEERDRRKSSPVRKVLIKKDKDVSPRRSHRPPAVPVTPTNVLYIYNLTRPFTLGQLRELLSRTGKIATDGFWIDNIKSKCYVEYETEDQAEETRHALHEVRWPVTNDKVLKVEFTTKDAMLNAQIKAETAEMPTQRKTEPLIMDRNSQRLSVREWDMGKVPEEEEKSRDRDRNRTRDREDKERDRKRKDRRYSESPGREEPDVRRRKRDIEAPAKLLDDLFRKTKTTPCLYWLPLTAEQIAVKEEMRKKHLAELEKRMKKNTTSSRSSRDRGSRRARRS